MQHLISRFSSFVLLFLYTHTHRHTLIVGFFVLIRESSVRSGWFICIYVYSRYKIYTERKEVCFDYEVVERVISLVFRLVCSLKRVYRGWFLPFDYISRVLLLRCERKYFRTKLDVREWYTKSVRHERVWITFREVKSAAVAHCPRFRNNDGSFVARESLKKVARRKYPVSSGSQLNFLIVRWILLYTRGYYQRISPQ